MPDIKTIEAGNQAPAFTLQNQDGNKIKLSDFGGQWVILYFYPKDNTSGCTIEANEFTALLKKFHTLKARVLGVSPDSVASHRKFADNHKLKVLLLSDPDKKVLEQYGAYGPKKMYGREMLGVIRSTFLIDPKGKIAYVWRKVKAAGHAEEVLAKLRELTVKNQ